MKKNQKEIDTELQIDIKRFMNGLEALMKEHNIKMEAIIQYTEGGVVPNVKLSRLDPNAKTEIKT